MSTGGRTGGSGAREEADGAATGRIRVGGTLAWLLLLVGWLVFTPGGGEGRLVLGPSWTGWEMAGNLFLLAPAAAILALAIRGSARRRIVTAGAWMAGCAALIESVQAVAGGLGRTATPSDALLNAAGAFLAAWIAIRLEGRGVPPARLVRAAAAAVAVALAAHAVHASAGLSSRFRLALWDPAFPIAAGDEVGGGRAYDGAVSGARICAGRGEGRTCAGPAAGPERRRRLAEAALRSQRVTLSATVLPGSGAQTGPARIVTFSGGTRARNATLAQRGSGLVLRLRTPAAGLNGDAAAFLLPDAVSAGRETRVTASYDRGLVRLAAEGGGDRVARRFPAVSFGGWWFGRRVEAWTEPGPLARAAAVGAFVACGTLGLAVVCLLPGRTAPPRLRRPPAADRRARGRWVPRAAIPEAVVPTLLGAGAGVLGALGLGAALQVALAPYEPLAAAAAGAVGGLLAWRDRRGSGRGGRALAAGRWSRWRTGGPGPAGNTAPGRRYRDGSTESAAGAGTAASTPGSNGQAPRGGR